MSNKIETLSKGFYTTQTGLGDYAINISFRTIGEMHSADLELRELMDLEVVDRKVDVQPAGGDLEVLGWIVTDMNGDFYFALDQQSPSDKALVDRAHVTRLQAERDRFSRIYDSASGALCVIGEALGVDEEDQSTSASLEAITQLKTDVELLNQQYEAAVKGRQAFRDAYRKHRAERDALKADVERLQKLSVTNILLDVVPGCDGLGEEVYAKSTDDVVATLNKQGYLIEGLESERDALQSELAKAREESADNLSDANNAAALLQEVSEWFDDGVGRSDEEYKLLKKISGWLNQSAPAAQAQCAFHDNRVDECENYSGDIPCAPAAKDGE